MVNILKQPVFFQNSPDVTFAGSLLYLAAIAICSLGLLLLSLGYPEWRTIVGLFLVSLVCGMLSHGYLSHSFGSLHIGARGMEYYPVTGGKTDFRWQELAHIKVLPGWLRVYNKQGEKIFSYTYGLGKQHTLIKVIAGQLVNRKMRPQIWPDVVSMPASKVMVRKTKNSSHVKAAESIRKERKLATPKIKQICDPLQAVTNISIRPRKRKPNAAGTTASRRT